MNVHVPGSNIHVQNVMCISNEQQSIYLVLMLILEITKSFLRENRSYIWPHSQPQISFFFNSTNSQSKHQTESLSPLMITKNNGIYSEIHA